MRVYFRKADGKLRILDVEVSDPREAIEVVVDYFNLPDWTPVFASVPTRAGSTTQKEIPA